MHFSVSTEDETIQWLETNDKPLNKVLEDWEKTYEQRQKILGNHLDVDSYIRKFKILQSPEGYKFVSI